MNINATILGQAIAFLLFVLFCMKYVWPPIMAALEKRQKEIAESIASAEQAKKDLELARIAVSEKLALAKQEAKVMLEQAEQHRIRMLDEARVQAEQERKKIIAQAQEEIESERKHVYEKLRKQVAALAVSGAEKIIGRTVDEKLNADIIDNLVTEL